MIDEAKQLSASELIHRSWESSDAARDFAAKLPRYSSLKGSARAVDLANASRSIDHICDCISSALHALELIDRSSRSKSPG
jgi:hypothetical protein